MAAGVRIGLEPLNRYETSLVNTVDQGLAVVAPLPSAGIGLMLDIYHMNIEETDLAAAVTRAGDRIAHVQVCGNDRGAPAAITSTGTRSSARSTGWATTARCASSRSPPTTRPSRRPPRSGVRSPPPRTPSLSMAFTS
ncbi:TIM barrel protein [Oerskovia sp. M15]